MNAPAPKGHNHPPESLSVETRLNEDYESLTKRMRELVDGLDNVPTKIEDEETAKRAADFAKQIGACIAQATEMHKEEKEPFLDGGRQVDAFFKRSIIEPLERVKDEVCARLTPYQLDEGDDEGRVRGDYGGLATLSTRWVGEVADRDDLDLEALRPHLKISHLDAAIAAFIKDGGRDLQGADIFTKTTTVIR